MNTAIFLRIWRFIRIPLGVILLLFIGLVIYRIPAVIEKQKTEEAILRIHAQKITLDDVMGTKLPPEPNQELNNSTIEGIDANQNGIRDDVELAIFKLYPDSAKIRAAELQYAMALQIYLVDVSNADTFITAYSFESLSAFCIESYLFPLNPSANDEQIKIHDDKASSLIKEVRDMVLNTTSRQNKHEYIPQGDATRYSDSFINNRSNCDIDLTSLPN